MRITFRVATILILISISSTALHAQTLKDEISRRFEGQQNLKEGIALIKEGKYKEAVVVLDTVIEKLKVKRYFQLRIRS